MEMSISGYVGDGGVGTAALLLATRFLLTAHRVALGCRRPRARSHPGPTSFGHTLFSNTFPATPPTLFLPSPCPLLTLAACRALFLSLCLLPTHHTSPYHLLFSLASACSHSFSVITIPLALSASPPNYTLLTSSSSSSLFIIQFCNQYVSSFRPSATSSNLFLLSLSVSFLPSLSRL